MASFTFVPLEKRVQIGLQNPQCLQNQAQFHGFLAVFKKDNVELVAFERGLRQKDFFAVVLMLPDAATATK